MKRYTWRLAGLELVMIAVAVLFMAPLYILFNLSVRSVGDPTPIIAPTTVWTGANFVQAWTEGRLGNALMNSAIVTACSVVLLIAISALAAYPLARATARWSRLSYILIMAGLLIPVQLGFIPLYRIFLSMNMLGSLWALVIFYAGLQVPFSVYLYASFIRALPREYEEAAAIDGAGPLRTFWVVMFPLLSPVTASVAIINVIIVWNDFMTPLLYLSGGDAQTVPVAVFGFIGQYTSNWSLVFAGLVVGIMPVLILFFLLQGKVMEGFGGGLKG